MENKKGFTLVEMIGSLVILLLLFSISFPSILKAIQKTTIKISKSQNELIKSSVIEYIDANDVYEKKEGDSYCITITDLLNNTTLTEKSLNDIKKTDVVNVNILKKDIKIELKKACIKEANDITFKLNGSKKIAVNIEEEFSDPGFTSKDKDNKNLSSYVTKKYYSKDMEEVANIVTTIPTNYIIEYTLDYKDKKYVLEREVEIVNIIPKVTDKDRSYVNYYADVDGNGTVDGVIFADLVTGNIGTGSWGFNKDNYNIPTISPDDAKDYYISNPSYSGHFGNKPVLTSKNNTSKKDRFYVLSIENVNSKKIYTWYDSAHTKMSDYATFTSKKFGTGKENTAKLIKAWNENKYGVKDDNITYEDLWSDIISEVEKGWFLPSNEEWLAFAGELSSKSPITPSTFAKFKLNTWYWTSSQGSASNAWCITFNGTMMYSEDVNSVHYLRLATTF